jgi:hypothetical protein
MGSANGTGFCAWRPGAHVIEKVKADIGAGKFRPMIPSSHRTMTFRFHASEEFWGLYNRMPRTAQRAADKQFEIFYSGPTILPCT